MDPMRAHLAIPRFRLVASDTPASEPCGVCGFEHPPRPFDAQMTDFKAHDRESPPRKGGIVFTGSSSFTMWRSLKADMAPLPAINRGFGGSITLDVIHYMDHVVFAYEPKIVVLYEGDNDISWPEAKADLPIRCFAILVDRLHARLPNTHLVFVSIKPSPSRWDYWPEVQKANTAIRDRCDKDDRLHYVDIVPTLLDEEGNVREERFREDRLHFLDDVYADWTERIKPVVASLWKCLDESSPM